MSPTIQSPLNAPISRRGVLRGAAVFSLVAVGGSTLLASCAPTPTTPGTLDFAMWGSPEETGPTGLFIDKYAAEKGVEISLTASPVDGYKEKLLAELVGNQAPDVFLATDDFMAKLVETGSVLDLTDLLNGPNSQTPVSAFGEDSWGAARGTDGRYYGVTTDANPSVIWHNKRVLEAAGVSEAPYDTFAAGNWTIDYFRDLVDKVVSSGTRAFVTSSWWFDLYPWLTNNGGTIYSDGEYVAADDPKSVEALQYLIDITQSEGAYNTTNMPTGQGQTSLFMADQIAFDFEGRWVVPQFRDLPALSADIVPYATPDGSIGASTSYTAFIVINKKSTNQETAFEFVTNYSSVEGQTFRHGEGDVSVPSIEGAEDVVLSAGYPEHAQLFMDIQKKAYPYPVEEARVPGLANALQPAIDAVLSGGGNAKDALAKNAEIANKAIQTGSLD